MNGPTTRVMVERCQGCGQETRYLDGTGRPARCRVCDAPLVMAVAPQGVIPDVAFFESTGDPRRQHEADPRRQRPQ